MHAAVFRALFLVALGAILIGHLSPHLANLSSLFQRQPKRTSVTETEVEPEESDSEKIFSTANKKEKLAQLASTMKNSCLPKLICELNASPEKDKLTQKAKTLLQIIRDTSMSTTAEVSSRYHFAAHMGQLIAGIDGTGCHNFYPGCPLPTLKVLNLINKPSLY